MKPGVVTAWTRQAPQVWEALQKNGVYTVEEQYIKEKNGAISEYYLELYRWFTQASRAYIAIPEGLDYPIWLALSEASRLPPAGKTVSLKLEVPREKLLIVDYDKWGYRVNHWYIPLDGADEEQHDQELLRHGIYNEALLIMSDKGNHYPALRQKIIRSWSRLFTHPSQDLERNVGTTWELRCDWVKEAVFCDDDT